MAYAAISPENTQSRIGRRPQRDLGQSLAVLAIHLRYLQYTRGFCIR